MKERTFGSDPEMMITKDGRYVSAIGIVQGSIENRVNLNGHQFYYDNVLAECAIRPGSSKQEVLDNFKECFEIYARMIHPFRITIQASQDYPRSELTHPDAVIVGCTVDCCPYEMVQKKGPESLIQSGTLRSCGGHIHLGSELLKAGQAENFLTLFMLDLFLAVPSLWLDKDPTSTRRRELYGQAGRYRVKYEYGIEYRPLGNFWIASPQLTSIVYDICMFVQDFVESGKAWDLWDFDVDLMWDSDTIQEAWKCKAYDKNVVREGINRSNKEMVLPHFELARSLMPKGLCADMINAIDQPQGEFYENWGLRI